MGDTLIQHLTKAIEESDSVVYDWRDEERKAFKIYRSFGESDGSYKINAGNRWSRASSAVRRAEQERAALIDSLSAIVKEKGQNNILGWKVNHVFNSEGKESISDDSYYTYYFDKDCSHILLRACGGNNQTLYTEEDYYYWSDDYVEIANRQYEEESE